MANSYRNNRGGGIEYTIHAKVGTITEYPTGWTKEINLITWNGGQPKFDIRDWDPEHEHMSKGITLHEEEARVVSLLLGSWLNGSAGRQHVEPVREGRPEPVKTEAARQELALAFEETESAPAAVDGECSADAACAADEAPASGDDVLFDPETGEVVSE